MKKFVSLSGGLGNQLFQLAGATTVYQNTSFTVEWSLGITNLNKNGDPEVFDYQLPESILLLPKKIPSKLQRKLVHTVLRRSSSQKLHPKKYVMQTISKSVEYRLSGYLQTSAEVIYPISLNANSVQSKRNRSEFLIGFFHSNRWVGSLANNLLLDNLNPKILDDYVVELQKLAVKVRPVILHIRLGDYEKEKDFGILPTLYYEESLEKLARLGFEQEIWIFTNDLDKAKEIFPVKFEHRAKWIPDFSDSSVQVLEAMRLGCAYVIGNSTFSWWAAKLARDKSAQVVAPSPWFRSAATHPELLPANWLTIDPWHSEQT
jgi:hypothetical protein